MTLITHSPEWHEDRRGGIGSSDAPIITGDAPWGDLLTLYAVKSGIIDEPDNSNAQTDWGLRLEDVVAAWFTERTGKKLQKVGRRRHPEHPWMRASLDRRVVGERALCEIKTRRYPDDEWGPGVQPAESIEEAEARPGAAEIPAHYLVQVQHQLAVTGYDKAYVAVLFAGSDPRYYVIPRDEALIASLIELEAEFMEAVKTGTPPEPLIRRQRTVVPLREGEILTTEDTPLARGIEGVYHLRAEIKERKADLTTAEDAVKTLLGPVTAARVGPFRATYKPNADSHPVRWELVAAAYRKALEKIAADMNLSDRLRHFERLDLDAIESLFTDTKPGARVLRITRKEEAANAA